MKKLTLLLVAVLFAAMAASAQIKYVAVVETEVDAQSGAAAKLNKAEVRLMTTELRSLAVKNLPRDKYNIMTSETVMSQGSAKLEECAEENCVIALGAKIGADYIVRGIVSKLGANLTMSVEMYETNDGNLVATSGVVRSGNTTELMDKAAAACAEMYKTFVATQSSAPKVPLTQVTPPKAPVTYSITATANPPQGGTVSRTPNQTYYEPGTNVRIVATPANGYKFTGWSGSLNSTKATLTGPIDRDLTLTANFQYIQKTYALSTSVSPQEGGYVTRNPNKETYTPGEQVTIMATPASGYKFTGWTGTDGRKNIVTVTMDGDKTVTANFYKQSVTAETTRHTREASGGSDYETAERTPMTGFSLGSSFNPGDVGHVAAQLGIVHSRPILENMLSFNVEGNIWAGGAFTYSGFFGFNVPATVLLQWYFISLEAGVDADLLFGADEVLFNAGFVVGAGVGFSKKHSRRYFYRYCGGYNYGAHVVGMWWLF
jgi:uncharacterized repeat protein (TIGR02543 family)